MKKHSKKLLLVLLVLLTILPWNIQAKEKIKIYLFWGDGCPHCEAEQQYLTNLKKENPELEIEKYEVWNHPESSEFLEEIATNLNQSLTGVPITIIGSTVIRGFSEATEKQIERAISYYQKNKDPDIVAAIKNGTYQQTKSSITEDEFSKEERKTDKENTVEFPWFGKVNLKNLDPIPAAASLGLFESFNIQPLVVLLLVIFLTFGTKRKYLVGLGSMLTYTIVWMFVTLQNISISTTMLWIFRIVIGITLLCAIVTYRKKRKFSPQQRTIYLGLIIVLSAIIIPNQYLLNLKQVMAFHQVESFSLLGTYIIYSCFYLLLYSVIGYILIKLNEKYFNKRKDSAQNYK